MSERSGGLSSLHDVVGTRPPILAGLTAVGRTASPVANRVEFPDMTPGRNDPCPCGSGRKFKRCCGAARTEASTAPPPLVGDRAVQREIPMIVNGDGHPTVQTTSLYEVGDPDSVFVEVESWRPKPALEKKRGPDRRLESFEAHYQRKPRARRAVGERVLVAHLTVEARLSPRRRDQLDRARSGDPREALATAARRHPLLRHRRALDVRSAVPTGFGGSTEPGQGERGGILAPARGAGQARRDHAATTPGAGATRPSPPSATAAPRTLVKTEAGRAKVLALLETSSGPPAPPGPGGMDCALIRRELGLPLAR